MATTTFLFADQVDSTGQIRVVGDVAARRLRDALIAGLVEATEEHGGRVVDLAGDGLFAAFTSSIDALDAAITMQSAVALANLGRAVDHHVGIRIGVHTGEPLGTGDDGYFGLPVVVARRLCDAAGGGQVLASGIVVDLAAPRRLFAFTAVGDRALKGVTEPVAVHEVGWERAAPRPELPAALAAGGLARAVTSRAAEQLAQLWDDAAGGRRRAAIVEAVDDELAPLVAGFVTQVWAEGGVVLHHRGGESALVVAVGPLLAHLSAAAIRMVAGSGAGQLATAIPAIGARLHTVEREPDDDPAAAGAVLDLLDAVAVAGPLLLVVDRVDDLTVADVELLSSLGSDERPGALLVVATTASGRSTERLAPLRRIGALLLVAEEPRDNGELLTRTAEAPAPLATVTLPAGDRVALDPGGTLIGRGKECAIRLEADLDVSRRHAELRAVGQDWVVRDLSSTNGTFVNGDPVTSMRPLEAGDTVRVGATSLVFTNG